jgi:hypothetical protein
MFTLRMKKRENKLQIITFLTVLGSINLFFMNFKKESLLKFCYLD